MDEKKDLRRMALSDEVLGKVNGGTFESDIVYDTCKAFIVNLQGREYDKACELIEKMRADKNHVYRFNDFKDELDKILS